MRSAATTLIIILSISLFGLIRSKMYVQNLESDIKKMLTKQRKLQNDIHVLKAEWSYLNRLERLEKLSNQHLSLRKISIKQIKKISLEDPGDTKNIIKKVYASNDANINTQKWRYKPRAIILKNIK